jgi:hypothetical protein
LKKSHSGNVQKNVVDVVVLAFSSSRSDPILRRKWRRLRELHTYSAPTTPPSRSSEIWWSSRWDRQHDGVVSMVESFRRQGFACLRGGKRTEKGGFRKRAAVPQKTCSQTGGGLCLFIAAYTITLEYVPSYKLTCPPRTRCSLRIDLLASYAGQTLGSYTCRQQPSCLCPDRIRCDRSNRSYACPAPYGRVGLRPNAMQAIPWLWPMPAPGASTSATLVIACTLCTLACHACILSLFFFFLFISSK